jgi:hypothetical protein
LLISKVKHYLSGAAPESTASASIFNQETESAINLFDTEPDVKHLDDDEKTMMLPRGPFGSAEPVSHEEAPREGSRSEMDIDAVRPVGEVVFGEDAIPAVELGAEEEEKSLFGASAEMEVDAEEEGLFSGRQEQEFEYTSGPVLEVSPTTESEGSIPLILPSADEPFGDVFQEPQPEMQWSSPSVSEEDSPFGMPEPPPARTEPIQEVEAPIEIEAPESFAEPVTAVEPERSAEPAGFDDTWPGLSMKGTKTQPVEELFDSEDVSISQVEDAEELQADLSEGIQEKPGVVAERQVEAAPATAQISEELIDRIAEKVLNKLSERFVSEIVWQVVPDLAEKMIRRELEKLHAGEE